MTQAERTWNWLWDILYAPTRHHLVYVYRLSLDGNPVGSFVWKGSPRPELPEILRDGLRGGDFRVLIRKKRPFMSYKLLWQIAADCETDSMPRRQ